MKKKEEERTLSIEKDDPFMSEQEQNKVPENDKSEYFEEYMAKMSKCQSLNLKTLQQKINSCSRFQLNNCFIKNLQKHCLKKDGNSASFKCSVGKITTFVNILRIHSDESVFAPEYISSGSFSKIYKFQENGKSYILKSQNLKKNNAIEFNQELNFVLGEFLFNWVASLFGFGPHVECIFGYDIIYFKNSFWFAMEYCETNVDSEKEKTYETDLRQNLNLMHSLGIVHRDIKEDNIAWSPYFSKWVFLDFGFTIFVEEKIGFKTQTGYAGTYQYMSKEMTKLYHLKVRGMVDLYYNDLYGFEKALQNNKRKVKRQQTKIPFFLGKEISQQKQKEQNTFSLLIQTFYFQNCLFFQNYTEVEQLIKNLKELRSLFLDLMIIYKQRHEEKYFNNQSFCQIIDKIIKKYQLQSQEKVQQTPMNKLFEKILKNAKKQKFEWQQLIFHFQDLEDFQKILKISWKRKDFMEALFEYINETKFLQDKKMNEKCEEICSLICENFIDGSEGKSKYWKFRHVLYEFEQYFTEQKNQLILQTIMSYYNMMDDKSHSRLIISKKNKKQNINLILSNFVMMIKKQNYETFGNLADDLSSLQPSNEIIDKKKQILLEAFNEFSKSQKSQKDGMNIVTAIFEKYQLEELQDFNQFSLLKKQIKKNKFLNNMQEKIDLSQQKFMFNCKNIQKMIEAKSSISNLFFSSNFSRISTYFERIPFLKKIANKQSCYYYFKEGKVAQAELIFMEIIQICQENIEFLFEEMYFIQALLKKHQKQYTLHFLQKFEQFSLKRFDKNNIHHYWEFLVNLSCSIERNEQKTQLYNKLKSIISTIINYSKENQPNPSIKFYTKLFQIHFCFISGKKQESTQKMITLFKEREEWGMMEKQTFFFLLQHYYFQSSNRFQNRIDEMMCQSFSSQENNQLLKNKSYLKLVLIAFSKKNMLEESYNLLKDISVKLSTEDKLNYYLTKQTFKMFGLYSSLFKTLEFLVKIVENQKLSTFRQNKFLSAFLLIKFQRFISQLTIHQRKRFFILSSISIDRCPFSERVPLKNKVMSHHKQMKESRTKRKRLIMSRRRGYAKNDVSTFLSYIEKKVERWKRRSMKVIANQISRKISRIQKNIEKNEKLSKKVWFY